MSGSAQHDPAYFSRRTTAFLLIVCLHALVVCGLAVALGRTLLRAAPPPIVTTVLPATTRTPPPPSLDPSVTMTGIERPRLDVPVIPITDPSPIRDRVAEPSPLPTSPPVRTVNRVVGGPGTGFPATTDYYPPAAIRLKEMGTAAVQVCVDANGRLTAAPVIAESSGSARLDEGALRLARAGSGHYRATTEDGRPVRSCYPFRIRFELRE